MCKVLIGTPMFGSKCLGIYLASVLRFISLATQMGIDTMFSAMCNESLLPRSRNYIADEFMRSDCDYLLFVDSDIGFNAEDAINMIRLELDMVGAQCPRKQIGIHWERIAFAIKNGCPPNQLDRLSGITENEIILDPNVQVVETDILQTGFMLIKKLVLQKLQLAYPENFYKPDHDKSLTSFHGSRKIQLFFSVEIDPISQRLLSEYEYFCNSWKKIGGKIHMCPQLVVSHTGLLHYS